MIKTLIQSSRRWFYLTNWYSGFMVVDDFGNMHYVAGEQLFYSLYGKID